jgi:hypothetical protein
MGGLLNVLARPPARTFTTMRNLLRRPSRARTLLLGLGFSVAYGLFCMLLVNAAHRAVSVSYIFVLPLVLGTIPVLFSTRQQLETYLSYLVLPWVAVLTTFYLSYRAGLEGLICLLIIVGPFAVLGSLGAFVVRWLALRHGPKTPLYASVLLLLPWVAGYVEQFVPATDQQHTVVTSLVVAAPAATIWAQVQSVRAIRPAEIRPHFVHWLGVPRPLDGHLDRPGVGGVRRITWEKGLRFQEHITSWQPGRGFDYRIDVDPASIPPQTLDEHVLVGGRYFDVLRGGYRLQPLDATHCRLTLRCSYRVTTNLNGYARLWADFLLNDFNEMILEVVPARRASVLHAQRGGHLAKSGGWVGGRDGLRGRLAFGGRLGGERRGSSRERDAVQQQSGVLIGFYYLVKGVGPAAQPAAAADFVGKARSLQQPPFLALQGGPGRGQRLGLGQQQLPGLGRGLGRQHLHGKAGGKAVGAGRGTRAEHVELLGRAHLLQLVGRAGQADNEGSQLQRRHFAKRVVVAGEQHLAQLGLGRGVVVGVEAEHQLDARRVAESQHHQVLARLQAFPAAKHRRQPVEGQLALLLHPGALLGQVLLHDQAADFPEVGVGHAHHLQQGAAGLGQPVERLFGRVALGRAHVERGAGHAPVPGRQRHVDGIGQLGRRRFLGRGRNQAGQQQQKAQPPAPSPAIDRAHLSACGHPGPAGW